MSVRAEKPRRLMLLPIWPPSAAPSVTPGTLRSASENELTACEFSTPCGTTTTACGMSRSAVGTFAPTLDVSGWKSGASAWPVTLTAGRAVVSDVEEAGDAGEADAAGACDAACGAV